LSGACIATIALQDLSGELVREPLGGDVLGPALRVAGFPNLIPDLGWGHDVLSSAS
jgi:hypothetical protein